MNEFPTQNTGLLLGQRDTDYLGGTIPYKVRVPSGDWRPYLPTGEKQRIDTVDVMACVTYSNLSDIEMQHIQQTGKEINLSDRFTAKMSGTTRSGNWQYKVGDSVRHDGVVLEADYPIPEKFTWDNYYAEIPQSIKDKAFKIDMQYEWVTKKDFAYHLKQAPLQIAIPAPHPNHAVVLVHVEGDTGYIYDSYKQYLKTINMSFISDAALKIVYNAKSMNEYVKTINLDGEVAGYVPLRNDQDIDLFNKIFNKNLVKNPDGSIPTDLYATKK
jgi:hypothetical protein